MIEITLKDGSKHQLESDINIALVHGRGTAGNGSIDWEAEQMPLQDVADQLGFSDALAAEVDGVLTSMDQMVKHNCTIDFIMKGDERSKILIDRTGLFMLSCGLAGVKEGVQRMGGTIEDGKLYYEVITPENMELTDADLKAAEAKANELIAKNAEVIFHKLAYYPVITEMKKLQEWHIINEIDAHDDWGPVWMNLCEDYKDFYQGMTLLNTKALDALEILSAEKTATGYKVCAQVR